MARAVMKKPRVDIVECLVVDVSSTNLEVLLFEICLMFRLFGVAWLVRTGERPKEILPHPLYTSQKCDIK